MRSESGYSIERSYLNCYTPLLIENEESKIYFARKSNSIASKPTSIVPSMGTYQGGGT
ncbi:MAG: hypothetical protein Q8908_05780 [Bacteroidota bacterium]|nr:hypothetical protein [Bacteroidota bacterium]